MEIKCIKRVVRLDVKEEEEDVEHTNHRKLTHGCIKGIVINGIIK
jgi:hypothetical protein